MDLSLSYTCGPGSYDRFKTAMGGVNYVLVYVLSVFICYIHVYIIDKISIKYKLPIFKYLKG